MEEIKFFAYIKNNKIDGIGECQCLNENIINAEITEEIYNNIDYYIWNGTDVVLDPDYGEKQQQKEKERIGHLKCTKRVFALILTQLGTTYNQLKELISSNERAQLEWELCVELERNNPLLDSMAEYLGFTHEQLDNIFKYANGEITQEQLLA